MDIYDVLRGKIRERMNTLADVVATGGCKDFAEYQRLCGTIEGLAFAEREVLDLKQLENESE